MADSLEQYRTITLRSPERLMQELEKLAKLHGTSLTGYINAVVIADHIYKNDTNVRLLTGIPHDSGCNEKGERKP